MNRASQVQLTVEDDDVVAVLLDAIHGTVEGPVEDDVRRLAHEARVVLRRELRRRLIACGCDFCPGVHARPALPASSTTTATSACAPGARFSRLRRRHRAQRHERAATA